MISQTKQNIYVKIEIKTFFLTETLVDFFLFLKFISVNTLFFFFFLLQIQSYILKLTYYFAKKILALKYFLFVLTFHNKSTFS